MPSNSTPTRLPSITIALPRSRASGSRILDVVDLVELDVPVMAVAQFDLADVDRLNDVAGRRIDGYRPARTRPRHAFHSGHDLFAVAGAPGLLDRFVDQMHAVVTADGMEVRPHSTVRFHEDVHVSLVFRRRVRGRIVMRADDAARRRPDGVEQIVVEDAAGADPADPGLTPS